MNKINNQHDEKNKKDYLFQTQILHLQGQASGLGNYKFSLTKEGNSDKLLIKSAFNGLPINA